MISIIVEENEMTDLSKIQNEIIGQFQMHDSLLTSLKLEVNSMKSLFQQSQLKRSTPYFESFERVTFTSDETENITNTVTILSMSSLNILTLFTDLFLQYSKGDEEDTEPLRYMINQKVIRAGSDMDRAKDEIKSRIVRDFAVFLLYLILIIFLYNFSLN